MTLNFIIQHLLLKFYQIHSNDDPMLAFDLFTKRSNRPLYAFIREKSSIEGFSRNYLRLRHNIDMFIELNTYIKIQRRQRSRSFFDMSPLTFLQKDQICFLIYLMVKSLGNRVVLESTGGIKLCTFIDLYWYKYQRTC